jgi:YggT family protein
MRALLCLILSLFQLTIIVRAILSWFPLSPDGVMFKVASVVYRVTEPVLGPVRRVLPRAGMLDLSPIVVLLACWIVQATVLRCSAGVA